jgi:NADH:ubiquinone oxidoreductase subunit F (NADH-binding)/Pyruvate/2-oxoacid:ferredoxin oxidoreductase delta subunit
MSTCGQAAGANPVIDAFKKVVKEQGIKAKIVEVGCIGACYAEPLIGFVSMNHPELLFSNVLPDQASKLLNKVLNRDASGAFAIRARTGYFWNEERIPILDEMDFFKHQFRDAIENCGIIDPKSIEEYLLTGGYKAIKRALTEMTPENVIEEVTASGLRGRGGAGFPTGLKWKLTRPVPGDKKYVICNADEGDPGAFMNRLNAEGDPHKILEGIIIAAYAIGADEGYIFVRAEKPLMAERFNKAVEEAKKRRILGKNLFSSGFNMDIHIMLSAGAFVCGEETALMAAIEGNRAIPRPRPPFPSTKGLWGKPTSINNVETLAHVPSIIAKGPKEFAKVGSERSKGTKVFCLTGSIERSGAVEVPLGTTLRTLIFEIGGGPRGGRRFKAIQTGGPSGGCLSEQHLDLPLDYESLQAAGSIMGSGGIVVMDETTCIVDVAKYFLGFTTAESCGQCVPCRIGLKRMHEILTDITEGRGKVEQLNLLQRTATTVLDSSLCALGRTAPNPVLTTLRYFKDEYIAHIDEKRCPAKVCKSLLKGYAVEVEICKGCGLCAKQCPANTITLREDRQKIAFINDSACIKCGQCLEVCPFDAVREVW